jgi:hypothetical protein
VGVGVTKSDGYDFQNIELFCYAPVLTSGHATGRTGVLQPPGEVELVTYSEVDNELIQYYY